MNIMTLKTEMAAENHRNKQHFKIVKTVNKNKTLVE